MPQTINTFVKSKMNKDLDDRLLSNGEYRDAQNVNVSRSEGEDVGALENILGNNLLSDFGLSSVSSLEIIGYYSDHTNNRAFFMATNHTDTSENELKIPAVKNTSSRCFILMRDFNNQTSTVLVQGSFLNFSKTHPIYGINIIEDLLFWTDNRNQPRKINVKKAISSSTYYTREEHISVAKYYPYSVPYFYDTLTITYTHKKVFYFTDNSSLDPTATPPTRTDINQRTDRVTQLEGIPTDTWNKIKVGMILKKTKDSAPNPAPGYQGQESGHSEADVGDYYVTEKPESGKIRFNGLERGGFYQGSNSSFNGSAIPDGTSQGTPPGTGTIDLIYSTLENRTDRFLPPCSSGIVDGDPGVGTPSFPPGVTPTTNPFTFTSSNDGLVDNEYFLLKAINGVFPEVGMRMTCPGKDNAWDSSGGPSNSTFLVTDVQRISLISDSHSLTGKNSPPNNDPAQSGRNGSSIFAPVSGNTGTLAGAAAVKVDPAPMDGSNPIILNGDIVEFSLPNPCYQEDWPGDKALLEDKFVRFAYRFKFDDGEYSLISPFTQPAFIPKQNGYFIDRPNIDSQSEILKQETTVGNSTVVSFMENNVNNVVLNIDMPYPVSQLKNQLKIEEIDILYKESDSLTINVVESIPVTSSLIENNNTNKFSYNYQSKKPFRVLPEKEISRVSDKVPIRALSQSVTGNRIVYGNIIDKHSPPENLDYNVVVNEKTPISNNVNSIVTYTNTNGVSVTKPINKGGLTHPKFSTISYPCHSLKQNRTYQVGIVLADMYGRQSDVILASDENNTYKWPTSGFTTFSERFSGSTTYSNYNSYFNYESGRDGDKWIGEDGGYVYRQNIWGGDSLKVLFRSKIPSTQTGEFEAGYPGLYKSGEYNSTVKQDVSNNDDIFINNLDINVAVGDIVSNFDANFYSITAVDYSNDKITINENVTITAGTFITVNGPENKLGWYSYKVVVKQTEQDYYNIYLPNVSLPSESSAIHNSFGGENLELEGINFYTSLVSDNINKISIDLEEVQPEQSQFRSSSDILFPRVGNNPSLRNGGDGNSNGFFKGQVFTTINGVGKIKDMGLQRVKLRGLKTGRVDQSTMSSPTTQETGRVVYNIAIQGGSGTGAYAKVKINNVNSAPKLNYIVITNGGKDYKETDTNLTIPAWGPSTSGFVEGQSSWSEITLPQASLIGLEEPEGEDFMPLTAPGIFNATSNPNVMVLASKDNATIGQEAEKDNPNNTLRPMVFSVFEIKPLNSNLEIFWETSTCGLVSELNQQIDENPSATIS